MDKEEAETPRTIGKEESKECFMEPHFMETRVMEPHPMQTHFMEPHGIFRRRVMEPLHLGDLHHRDLHRADLQFTD